MTGSRLTLALLLAGSAAAVAQRPASPAAAMRALHWQGHRWQIVSGHVAGVAPGNPKNVFLDQHGYLHLRLTQRNGRWTAAELRSLDRPGFGTYQWQVEGDVFAMDPTAVLGLFLYGPAAHIGADGQNEIDIEFSQWNGRCHCNADFALFFPPQAHTSEHWSDHFSVHGSGQTTVRIVWSPSRIVFTIMDGFESPAATDHVLRTATFRADTAHIPQQPLPIEMNLWSSKATPAQNQEIVIRSFQFQSRHSALRNGGTP